MIPEGPFPWRLTFGDMVARRRGCTLAPCDQWADCLLDGEPFCLDCADAIIERAEVVAGWPLGRRLLPALTDRVPGV